MGNPGASLDWSGQHGQPYSSVWACLGIPGLAGSVPGLVSPWTNQIPRHVHIMSLLLLFFFLQARPHPKQKKKMNSMIELTSPKWPVHELHRNIGRALKKIGRSCRGSICRGSIYSANILCPLVYLLHHSLFPMSLITYSCTSLCGRCQNDLATYSTPKSSAGEELCEQKW